MAETPTTPAGATAGASNPGTFTAITSSRTVTDGVTNSTVLVTSATASFVAGDVGRVVTGTADLPNADWISVVSSGTNVNMAVAATAGHTGQTLNLNAILSFQGRSIRMTQRTLLATMSLTASLLKTGIRIFVATIVFSGRYIAAVSRRFVGGLSFVGQRSIVWLIHLPGVLTFAGHMGNVFGKVLTASLHFVGSIPFPAIAKHILGTIWAFIMPSQLFDPSVINRPYAIHDTITTNNDDVINLATPTLIANDPGQIEADMPDYQWVIHDELPPSVTLYPDFSLVPQTPVMLMQRVELPPDPIDTK